MTRMRHLMSAGCALALNAGACWAHVQQGELNSGTAAAVDFYQIVCSDDGSGAPYQLQARIMDTTANTSRVGLLVQKGTVCTRSCARNTTDRNDANTSYSPGITVIQGAGVYNAFVSHNATGVDGYTLEFHCQTVDGLHAGTTISGRQQQ